MRRKAYFNEMAKDWDEIYYTRELASVLKELVLKFGLESGQTILDVGTGTGVLIPFLLQIIGPSGSITAIDYAENMVHRCKSKYSHHKNVTIELQDVENLNFPSGSFDAITCFGLFPHLDNKEKVLHHLNRVLKHGGKLIIAHALSSTEIKAHHRISSAIAHDVLPEKEEIEHLLKRAGFTEISIKDEKGCYLCLSAKR